MEPALQGESEVSAWAEETRRSEPYRRDHRSHGVRAPGGRCHAGASRPVAGLMSNTRALPRSHCSSCRATSSAGRLRNAHSQTIATRQPASSRSRRLCRSRSVFASNLACQNFGRVVGVVVYWQSACRCQKQPCTKHTAPKRRNTRSGLPGSLRSCRRYRSPRAWMARRRTNSGRVFLLPIPAIMRERVVGSTMSAIVVPVRSRRGYPDNRLHDTSISPRCGHAPTEDRAAASCGAISPFECDP